MLRPRAASCGTVLGQVRYIVRRAFPLQASLPCHVPSQTRHFSSSELSRGSLPELKEQDQSPDYIFSFVDQRSDMRSLRREIIRQINHRFPRISVKMPMYGPLFREDIVLSPKSNSSRVEKYLDDQFSKYASTIMKIPPGVHFDREHVLLQKVHLSKEFVSPISLTIKDRNVFLTAHKNEIQKLKSLAENLVKSEFLAEVISDLDEETYGAVQKSSNYLIPKEFEEFAKPVQFDEGSIVMKGNRKALSAISNRVKQLIKYQSDPIKDCTVTPKTLLTLLQHNLKQEELLEKFPSVTTLVHGGKDTEVLISGQSSTELDQFKEWFEGSYLCDYHTERRELDRYQTIVAERLLASHLKTGTAILSRNADESSNLELSFYKTDGKRSLLFAIQNVCTIQFDDPVINHFLKVNGRKMLPSGRRLSDVTVVSSHDAVIFFGGNDEKRKREKDKMEQIIDGLFIVGIPFPHGVFKNMVVEKDGKNVRNKYPGVFSFVAKDSSKITVVAAGERKEMAEKFADDLRREIDGLDVAIYSKTKASIYLFRLDDPELKNYTIQNQISVQKVSSSDPTMDSWLIYGQKEAVHNFLDLLEQKEQEALIGKVTEHVQASDYSTWHSYLLYARELNNNNGAMKCLYDDHLRSSPGRISLVGPPEEVKSALENFQRQISKQLFSDDSKVSSEISGLTQDDLRIASSMKFSFPNTKVSTNAEKTGLVVSSNSPASLKLAKEYITQYFGNAKELTFGISAKHSIFMKQNWDTIKDAVEWICLKSGVKYRRNFEERSLTLYGLPTNTASAKENLDTYFLKKYRIGDLLQAHDTEFTETVEIDKAKLEAILDPDLGNFRRANINVSVQALMGKMGSEKSYLRLKSTSNSILKDAATSLCRVEAEMCLKNYQISQSTYELAKVVDRASPHYGWLFPNGGRKVLVKLDSASPQFNIAYKSNTDLEEANRKLEKHFESFECLKEIELPTKKMRDVMANITEYMQTLDNEEQNAVKVIISETENKIVVFGKESEVVETTMELSRILSMGHKDWEVFEVRLDGCNDVKTAVQIRAQILKMFPYLMVDQIPYSGYGNSESDVVLRISTLVERMEQYPATKVQLDQFISQLISERLP